MVEGRSDRAEGGRIRLGMVGGGQGAFIGAVHRLAARMDDQYELVAGALSSDPQAREGLGRGPRPRRGPRPTAPSRRWRRPRPSAPTASRRWRSSRPNHMHAPVAKAFLEAGIHVICDKPLTATVDGGEGAGRSWPRRAALIFALTHNYTGYPMIRQARAMIAAGELGEIRVVQAEYAQDWLTEPIEATGQKQAAWRTDPKQSGAGGAVGDIGTHAYNLACFVTGLKLDVALRRPHHLREGPAASTTTSTSCCASRAARGACSGRARSRPATRTA